MTILLIILLAIVGLILLLLILALFTKKDYAIEREITINKSKTEVFNYIRYLKNQDHYSKWNRMDPSMTKDYKGTDGSAGFVYYWDSLNKNAGKGEQEIKSINEDGRMDTEVRFIRPFAGVANAFMQADRISEQQTKVKWGMKSAMKYPMNIMLLFMNMDALLGKDLEISLANLKAIMEK